MPRFLGLSLGQQPCTMAMNPNPVILPKSPTESPRAKGSDLFHLLPEFSDLFLIFSSSWYMLILFSWHLPAMPTMVNVSRLGSQKCFQKSQLLGECELHQTASKHLTESVIKKKNRFGNPMVGWVVIRGRNVPCHTGDSRVQTLLSKCNQIPNTRTRVISCYITSKMTKWP